ncbi:hypothetical protein [Paraburkholderia oxyphila]|nr:hypothetical protein [Paraburkholderia oxyphila]
MSLRKTLKGYALRSQQRERTLPDGGAMQRLGSFIDVFNAALVSL